MAKLQIHPLANAIPEMTPEEKAGLAKDIKKNGLKHAIVLCEGKILDGKHRYNACLECGIEPRTKEYKGNDPLSFVISMNVHRRHWSQSQRAAIATDLSTLSVGRPENNSRNSENIPQSEAAKVMGVSVDSVAVASKIKKKSPKLFQEVKDGKITLNGAEKKIEEEKPNKEPEPEKRVGKDGYPIPAGIIPLWDKAEEVADAAMKMASKLKCIFEKAHNDRNPIWVELYLQDHARTMQAIFWAIKSAIPFAVCTICNGRTPDKCTYCKGRGFLSETLYGQTDDRIRAMRKAAARV